MWDQILDFVAKNPNLAGGAVGAVGMFFTALFSFWLKRPIVRQAVAADDFKATLAGMRELNTSLLARISYYQAQETHRDEYESQLRARIRELDPEAIDRRWRHMTNNLVTVLVGYRDRLRALGQSAVLTATMFEDFIRDGGMVPQRWYDVFEIRRPIDDELDVLMVDDNEALARRWVYQFEQRGYSVRWVPDVGAALAVERDPRIVLLDIVLGPETGQDGRDLAKTLRERGYAGPIIAVTGNADPAKLDRDLFAEVLEKPVRFDQLLAAVVRHLGEKAGLP